MNPAGETSLTPRGSGAAGRRRPPAILAPGRVKPSALVIAIGGALLVAVQIVNWAMGYRLNGDAGIMPRTASGLWGVAAAPLLHTGWGHLAANLVPFLIFGFLILIAGLRQFLAVTILVWLIAGFGVWLTAPSGHLTVGASTLVFGWLAFLVLRGVFSRRLAQVVMGLVLLALWGGIFWGVLPGREGISWQGHLFGAIAGALAAFLVARADAPAKARSARPASPALPGS